MAGPKFVKVINALTTDTEQVGAEFTNQLVDLVHAINIEADEGTLAFNTAMGWYSGKFFLYDSNHTHTFTHTTENIASNINKTILWRDMTQNTDSPVLEKEFQTLLNKTMGTGTKFSADLDIDGFNLIDINALQIRDMGDRNLSFIEATNATPNSYFDILAQYNTANFAAISSATDIKVRLGFNSEIDTYEIWSRATGVNTKLFSMTPALLDLFSTTINFNDKILTNVRLTELELKNQVVEPVADATIVSMYRNDIDAQNQRGYITKLENNVAIKVRVF